MQNGRFLAIVIIGIVVFSGISSAAVNVKTGVKKIKVSMVSQSETQSEKTALPYYLNGTILDGSKRIIVTSTGKPLEGTPVDAYDIVISYEEEDTIIEDARTRYMEKYGIDPCKREPNIADRLSPIEVWFLAKMGILDLADARSPSKDLIGRVNKVTILVNYEFRAIQKEC